MKKLLKALLIMAVIGGALMGTGYALGAETSMYIDLSGLHIGNEERTMQSQTDIGELREIEIDVMSANIEIIPSDKPGLEIMSRENVPIIYTLDGGRLKITQDLKRSIRLFNMDFDFTNDTVIVYVPEIIKLDNVNIKTLSGKVSVDNLNSRRIGIIMASGDVHVYNAEADEIVIRCTSGNAELSLCEAGLFDFVLTSGNLRADRMRLNGLSAQLTSGDAEISGEFNGNNAIKVLSGDVKINIDGAETDYSRSVSRVGGNVYVNGGKNNENAYTSAKNGLDINITSGEVRIEFSK